MLKPSNDWLSRPIIPQWKPSFKWTLSADQTARKRGATEPKPSKAKRCRKYAAKVKRIDKRVSELNQEFYQPIISRSARKMVD